MTRSDLESLIVADVMRLWPATVGVFRRRRMACPGCAMAPFMTVAETARSYDFAPGDLAAELLTAIAPSVTAEDDATARGHTDGARRDAVPPA